MVGTTSVAGRRRREEIRNPTPRARTYITSSRCLTSIIYPFLSPFFSPLSLFLPLTLFFYLISDLSFFFLFFLSPSLFLFFTLSPSLSFCLAISFPLSANDGAAHGKPSTARASRRLLYVCVSYLLCPARQAPILCACVRACVYGGARVCM